jgi:exodeoxyribonuclease X
MMDNAIFTIDFETTGVDAKTAEPVEVAIADVSYDECFSMSRLIKPTIPIPPETSAIHHITDEDVEYEECWSTVRSYLIRTILDYNKRFVDHTGTMLPILVAHNAQYERDILAQKVGNEPPFPPVIWICTYKCALRIWPDAPNHKNEGLRYWLKLGDNRGRSGKQNPHSAMHDAQVTKLLLLEMLKHATLEELVQWTEEPTRLPKMPMGKHFGQAWDTIPAPYLQWCIAQADMREDVVGCAKLELTRRKESAAKRSG